VTRSSKSCIDLVNRGSYGVDPTSTRALKMSRNRLILRALERELTLGSDWSPGFSEQLSAIDSETAAAVNELLASVH
jgi:hypothetical protein